MIRERNLVKTTSIGTIRTAATCFKQYELKRAQNALTEEETFHTGALALSSSILIVEDDDSVRKSLLRTLIAHGMHPVGVSTGMEALQLAVAAPPDLIIMDLQLPVMSGVDIVRALRRHHALASVPVIALSATLEDAPPELFVRALLKPCSTVVLVAAIEEALGNDAARERRPLE